MDLSKLTNEEVVDLLGSVTAELRRRGLESPRPLSVGDLAEELVVEHLGLQRAPKSTAGYDAIADDGTRYQIKARRLGTSGDRQLGVIRNIDRRDFNYLVVVLFPPESDIPRGMWQLPFDLVREKAKPNKHQNGHVLFAADLVLTDARVEQLWGAPIPAPPPLPPKVPPGGPGLHQRAVEKAVERLDLHVALDISNGYDAEDDAGKRYLIKARTAGSARDYELGAIKNIDRRSFDYLVFVLFDRASDEYRMWQLPFDLVRREAVLEVHKNGHVLYARPFVLGHSQVKQLH